MVMAGPDMQMADVSSRASTGSQAPAVPGEPEPRFRPRDQFWPYADLEEEPSEEELAKLDPAADWQGTVRYNLACHYALTGQKEAAIAALGEALVLNPGLRDWSKQDTDLACLREEPGYLDLYAALP